MAADILHNRPATSLIDLALSSAASFFYSSLLDRPHPHTYTHTHTNHKKSLSLGLLASSLSAIVDDSGSRHIDPTARRRRVPVGLAVSDSQPASLIVLRRRRHGRRLGRRCRQ